MLDMIIVIARCSTASLVNILYINISWKKWNISCFSCLRRTTWSSQSECIWHR